MSSSDATTSVPACSMTAAGFIAPSEPDILAGVQADINAALGGNVNPALNTPQGQLATSETAIIGDCNDQLLALFNGFDPRNAIGRQQDALGYIYFMTRNAGEGRAAFEARREATVEGNSVGVNAAIYSAILQVSGVTDVYVVDNPDDVAQTIGGLSLPANSLYCCVAGGAPSDIALAILSKKPPGCSFAGQASAVIQDPAAVYNGNGPSYTVNYDVAIPADVYVTITIKNSSLVPSTATADLQAAVIAAFNGVTDGNRITINSPIYASRFYCPVAAVGSWVQIETIKVGSYADRDTDFIQFNINQLPVISAATIFVTLV
ncbi:MAG: hypothetical protein ABF572_04860 [Gluconobacter sp.]|uniref:hypothetical protein n=1 Tax=Gluconobacter sp. TaxID=1876758 RepID=UPI0039E918B0